MKFFVRLIIVTGKVKITFYQKWLSSSWDFVNKTTILKTKIYNNFEFKCVIIDSEKWIDGYDESRNGRESDSISDWEREGVKFTII